MPPFSSFPCGYLINCASIFLLIQDLDSENWPEERNLADNGLIGGLLGGGFRTDPPICNDNENIDGFLKPVDQIHVVDADSSQTLAIEEAKSGRNLVIQGPPGTGKSQTITNVIAAAVHEGKKVLFVAEKMAALQVVRRRLDNIGLGSLCLELHSHKSNKRVVLNELSETLELGKPKVGNNELHASELEGYRAKLNRHARDMHTYLKPSSKTPFQIIGELVRLQKSGIAATSFVIDSVESWNPEVFQNNCGLIKDLQIHLESVGNPADHPWKGVQVKVLLPADHARLQERIVQTSQRLNKIIEANEVLANEFKLDGIETIRQAVDAANHVRLATQAPEGFESFGEKTELWGQKHEEIRCLLDAVAECNSIVEKLEPIVADVAWDTDLSQTRIHLRSYGKSWLRFLNSKYRSAKAELMGVLDAAFPKALNEQLDIVDGILSVRKLRNEIQSASELGSAAFGLEWHGEKTDVEPLVNVLEWYQACNEKKLPDCFFQVAASTDNHESMKTAMVVIRKNVKEFIEEVKGLVKDLELDVGRAFSTSDLAEIPTSEVSGKLRSWENSSEPLSQWIGYASRIRKLRSAGMEQVADLIDDGQVSNDELFNQFEACYFESLMKSAYSECPGLAEFNGISHAQTLQRFCEMDIERQAFAREQVAQKHYEMLPNHNAHAGEIGVVRREIAKKRRNMPIRKLLAEAGHAIQAIKPVFMMSPISVAQFLEPGVLEFDVLLMDEASQVRPVDALGAMARAKQVIVVGDERQLPPTNFFSKMTGADDDDSDVDDFNATDIESVLGLCSAQNINQRMLRWHYRSRHQSLIAVSNYEFYESRLNVIPSPSKISKTLGLSFVHVKDGVFDRGKSRTNRIEAEAVADAVIEFVKNTPHKTLGVAAFSVAQRDAIRDAVEARRRKNPGMEEFFADGSAEPFFIKNIENVQGDERDTIMISVGYGRDSSGYLSMSFGPLQNQGGERRLNVLITRSKEQCIVFSSITADDIDLTRAKSRGVAAFKTFLTYAKSGFLDVAVDETDRGFDSPFEMEVAKALKDLGYEIRSQIGVAGFFIDLAVVDTNYPGRYLLGIECDGASYHSSRSARDRDRIRQAVLEDRDWIIHRIWSTDWFNRPEEQLRQVQHAIDEAKIEWSRRDQGEIQDDDPLEENGVFELEREEQEVIEIESGGLIESEAYLEADFSVDTAQEIHELSPEQLSKVVERIVQIEGPVHASEISRRVASVWQLNRTGSRISRCVDDAISYLSRRSKVRRLRDFVVIPDAKINIRNRAGVESDGLRKPELLPPDEIQVGLEAVVATHLGIEPDEAVKEVASLFGFKSTSSKLKSIIKKQLYAQKREGLFEERNGRLYAVEKK